MKELPALPHNEEAEQVFLASLILDNTLINEALDGITEDYFYTDKNQVIYSAIIELAK